MTAQTATRPNRITYYGFRITGGAVMAFLREPVRGRCPERYQLQVGNVLKVAGGWRNDLSCDVYSTQTEAARRALAIACN